MSLYKLRLVIQEDVTIEREDRYAAEEKARELESNFQAKAHHGQRMAVSIVKPKAHWVEREWDFSSWIITFMLGVMAGLLLAYFIISSPM